MKRFEDKFEQIDNSPIGIKFNVTSKEVTAHMFNALVLIAFILASFVTIDENLDVQWSNVGRSAIIIFFASFMVYCNSLSIGKISGAKNSVYIEAKEKCEDAIGKLIENKYAEHVNEYCLAMQQNDLETRRKRILGAVFVSYEKYVTKYMDKSYKQLKRLTKAKNDGDKNSTEEEKELAPKQIKAIMKANCMRYHKFDPQMLMRPTDAYSETFIRSASRADREVIIRRLVTSAIMTFVVVDFGVEMVKDLTFKTIVECLIKIFPIVWNWITGRFKGYALINDVYVGHFKDKARYCLQANNWLNERYGQVTA
ncbi:MAG: hypothetical protein OSJ74_00010 [Clostridia bacterium]|nr:hypothetical protein [Clostridia bacterium]